MNTRKHLLLSIILLLTTVMVIALPGIQMGVHADDWMLLRVRTIEQIWQPFVGNWTPPWDAEGGLYRPMVVLSFALDDYVFSSGGVAAHLHNGLLFGVIILGLMFLLIELVGLTPLPATLLAIVGVGLNPLSCEPLYWISGRGDLLATAFLVWSGVAAVLSLRDERPGLSRVSLLLLVAALLTKETAVAGLLAIPLFAQLAPAKNPIQLRQFVLRVMISGAGYALLRTWAIGGLGGYTAVGLVPTTGEYANRLLQMTYALGAPWQLYGSRFDSSGGFVLLLLLAVAAAHPNRRLILALMSLCLVAITPGIFVGASPADGTRILLFPVCLVVLAVGAILAPALQSVVGGAFAVGLVSLIGISFFPAVRIAQHEFLTAAAPAKSSALAAKARALATPPDSMIVFAPPKEAFGRPILRPSAALHLAVEQQLLQRVDATLEIQTQLRPPVFLRKVTHEGVGRFLAAELQPGMDAPLFYDALRADGTRSLRALERLWIMPFEGGMDIEDPSADAIYAFDFWRDGADRPEVRINVRFADGGQAELVPWFFTFRGASMAYADTGSFDGRVVVSLDVTTPPVEGLEMWVACFAANPVDSPWRAD